MLGPLSTYTGNTEPASNALAKKTRQYQGYMETITSRDEACHCERTRHYSKILLCT